MKRIGLTLAKIALFTGVALAHSPLKSTHPAAEETFQSAPDVLRLEFGKPSRVTKVTVTRESDGQSKTEKLVLSNKKFATHFRLATTTIGSGIYTVNWRALSRDGHAIKGDFQYTVTGN